MTPQEAQEHLASLEREEIQLFRDREIKQEQIATLNKNIQDMSQRLLTLRAAREAYTLAAIALQPHVESNSGSLEPATSGQAH